MPIGLGSAGFAPELAELKERAAAAGVPLPQDLLVPLSPVPGASRTALHVTSRDGVRLAVDLVLPAPTGQPVPTCVRSTRYWRSSVGAPAVEHVQALEAQRWSRAGFALVLLDARGTGASFGTWDRCWDDTQRDDLYDLLDWIVAQPWSDGTVGGYGTSYDGTAAHLLAATGHPAVRAVVPRFGLYDSYADISAPGGVPLDWFMENWATINWALDGHPERGTAPQLVALTGDVRPVDAELLEAARAEHAGNWDLWGDAADASARDHIGPLPDLGNGTPLARIDDLRAGAVPMWLWSGWYDGAYANAQLVQVADKTLDARATIGPFAHGAGAQSLGDPLQPELHNVPGDEQVREIAGFLRARLAGPTRPGVADPAPAGIRYWRLGDGWQETDVWPPTRVDERRFDLEQQVYTVDFSASTGSSGTRWHTLIGGGAVTYPDRRDADMKLAVWEWALPEGSVEITGHPVAHVEAIANVDDFAVHLYLEAVLPDGFVLYLTEGQLRAWHRKVSSPPAGQHSFGPWHSLLAADAAPVVPGAVTVLEVMLWPISVLLPAGSRLRLALAGADAPLFRRIPASGDVTLTVGGWLDVPLGSG